MKNAKIKIISKRILSNLSDGLLTKTFREIKGREPGLPATFGHCYVASETAYHLLGGKKSGWKPQFVKHLGCPHWFLKHQDGMILDLTSEQFQASVDYERAIGKGFLTQKPSKRARVLIRKVKNDLNH